MTDDDDRVTVTDDDDRVTFTASNTTMVCLTVAFVSLIVCSFGSCLYHCEGQADRRIRCIELTHDVEACSKSFEGNK
jgi:hypothetical protein